MTDIKSIFKIKEAPKGVLRTPERQSIEQTEDYAQKKVVRSQEIYNNDIKINKVSTNNFISSTESLTIRTTAVKILELKCNDVSRMVVGAAGVAINSLGNVSRTSAALDVVSTTLGCLLCPMTTAQKNAIANPVEGLEVYDLDLHKKCVYTGAVWETMTSA
jgi:uncharacterized membrane protein